MVLAISMAVYGDYTDWYYMSISILSAHPLLQFTLLQFDLRQKIAKLFEDSRTNSKTGKIKVMKISSTDEAINTLSESMENIVWKDFSSYKKAEYLMNNKPDCSFLVGRFDSEPKTFHSHKWILRCASPVFDTMFNGNFKESNVSKEIYVTDTDPSTFKKFLDFVYYGDIESFQFMDIFTVRNLVYLGKKYMITALTDACISNMKKNIENVENCDLIGIFEYAYLTEEKDLIEKCRKVIIGRRPKPDFKVPVDYNINRHEDKRHIAIASRTRNTAIKSASTLLQMQPNTGSLNFPNAFNSESNTNRTLTSFSSAGGGLLGQIPNSSPEKKIENTEFNPILSNEGINIFGETVFGVNKGDITTCSYIYELSPPIFYEFQKALTGYISEMVRFNMIEMYAKINGFIGEITENVEKLSNNNNNKTNDSVEAKTEANGLTFDNMLAKTQTVPLQKEMLNMMLCSINFLRMSAKEFTRGPGKSNLLDMEEKYNILVGIININ